MAKLRVEVVYALAGEQHIVSLEVAAGTSAADAAAASGLPERHGLPGGSKLGLGGRLIRPGQVLRDGDRVEILRPLALDPKDARRIRARGSRRR